MFWHLSGEVNVYIVKEEYIQPQNVHAENLTYGCEKFTRNPDDEQICLPWNMRGSSSIHEHHPVVKSIVHPDELDIIAPARVAKVLSVSSVLDLVSATSIKNMFIDAEFTDEVIVRQVLSLPISLQPKQMSFENHDVRNLYITEDNRAYYTD